MQQFNFNTFANTPQQQGSGFQSRYPTRQVISPGYSPQNHVSNSSLSQMNQDMTGSYHQNVSIPELKRQMQQALKPNLNTFTQDIHDKNENIKSKVKTFGINSNIQYENKHKKSRKSSYKKSSAKKSRKKTENSFNRSKVKESSRVFHQNKSKRQYFGKYPLQISLMKSDVSMISTDLNWGDLSRNLRELELTVTDDVLTLRQQKLTLMQEYNNCLDQRYRLEREINRLQKQNKQQKVLPNILESEKESRKPSGNITQKNQQSQENQYQSSYFAKNKQQTIHQNQYQQEEQSVQHLQRQISDLRYKRLFIQRELDQLQQKTQQIQQQRFETFFPHQKQQEPQFKKKSGSNLHELNRLRQIKNQLLIQLSSKSGNQKLKTHFLELYQQNRELQQKAQIMLQGRRKNLIGEDYARVQYLKSLQEQINEQQKAKELFYQDLKKFKIEMNRMKQENQEMKRI